MHLEQLSIASSAAPDFVRNVWYGETEPAGGAAASTKRAGETQICIFLDGEYYVNHMDSPAVLQRMYDEGMLPAMACLFVSHLNGAARHSDLACNKDYADYITRDLLGWVRARLSGNGVGAESEVVLAGISLSGLQAAYTSLLSPRTFTRTIAHSGSFWWRDEWLTAQRELMRNATGGRFYISVGDRETEAGVSHPPTGLRQNVTQIDGCQRFAEKLREQGAEVRYHVYEGGHQIAPWKDEFPQAMQWLFPIRK